jgi:2-methylcitrate dehydratase PrpD
VEGPVLFDRPHVEGELTRVVTLRAPTPFTGKIASPAVVGAPKKAPVPVASSAALAAFITGLRYADLPPHVVDAARRHLLDTLGVAIRGRSHAVVQDALRGLQCLDGAVGDVAVWGASNGLAAPYAALVNGIACHVLDFDDTHTDAIVHGSAIIAPVVLALAQQHDRGGDAMLAAFVAGWEVAARVGLASRGTFHRRGFHTTAIAGVFGATAAAAHLLALSAEQTTHALGLAGSQAAGINEYLSNGSSAKSFHAGWAAHAGIVAAGLASAGMTGPGSVFEGRDGLLRTHGDCSDVDAAALDAGLGTRWETTRVSIKPYPCCHFAHAFVDCIPKLVQRGMQAANIVALECVVPEIEVALICEPAVDKRRPATPYAAKFSLPFLLASRLVDGTIGHHSFDSPNLARPDLIALAARVGYRMAKPGETPFPAMFPGWVEATLADGRRLVEHVDVNAGHPDNPLSDEAVHTKFVDNARDALGGDAALRVAELVAALPRTSAADLAHALRASRTSSSPSSRTMS